MFYFRCLLSLNSYSVNSSLPYNADLIQSKNSKGICELSELGTGHLEAEVLNHVVNQEKPELVHL